jgi:hypothetical protein
VLIGNCILFVNLCSSEGVSNHQSRFARRQVLFGAEDLPVWAEILFILCNVLLLGCQLDNVCDTDLDVLLPVEFSQVLL